MEQAVRVTDAEVTIDGIGKYAPDVLDDVCRRAGDLLLKAQRCIDTADGNGEAD